jgi:hypothetical protein
VNLSPWPLVAPQRLAALTFLDQHAERGRAVSQRPRVMPANAGIQQSHWSFPDSRLRGNDNATGWDSILGRLIQGPAAIMAAGALFFRNDLI